MSPFPAKAGYFYVMAPGTTAARRQKIFAAPLDIVPRVAYIYVIASASGRSANGRKATIMSKSQSVETSNIAASAIRQALRAEFGARRYRITRDGEIHAYGVMPNSNVIGWWLYGWVGDSTTMARLGLDS